MGTQLSRCMWVIYSCGSFQAAAAGSMHCHLSCYWRVGCLAPTALCVHSCTVRTRTPAGAVAAVQGSLSSLYEMVTFSAAAVMHQPERFHFFLLGSLASVVIAWGMYMGYALRPQRRYQLIQETVEL
jgi:hypothetical protein